MGTHLSPPSTIFSTSLNNIALHSSPHNLLVCPPEPHAGHGMRTGGPVTEEGGSRTWVTIRGLSPAERERDAVSTPEEFSELARADQPDTALGSCPLGKHERDGGRSWSARGRFRGKAPRGWWAWASRARRAFPARGKTHSAPSSLAYLLDTAWSRAT